jgi:hypothetical protein
MVGVAVAGGAITVSPQDAAIAATAGRRLGARCSSGAISDGRYKPAARGAVERLGRAPEGAARLNGCFRGGRAGAPGARLLASRPKMDDGLRGVGRALDQTGLTSLSSSAPPRGIRRVGTARRRSSWSASMRAPAFLQREVDVADLDRGAEMDGALPAS